MDGRLTCKKTTDNSYEVKQIISHIQENEEAYISGERNFSPVLQRNEEIYENLSRVDPCVDDYRYDSEVLALGAKIINQNVRSYRVDKLSFNPRHFSMKTRNFFGLGSLSENPESPKPTSFSTLWSQLGEYSKKIMYTVPSFNYIYGTFDIDPVEPAIKKRRQIRKDKIGVLTQPKEVNVDEVKGDKDAMCVDAARMLSIFKRLEENSTSKAVSFYEFVIDPTSFTRTIEYIFLISLLVQHGHLCIFVDDLGLPYIKRVENKNSEVWSTARQTALSISKDEWKSLIKTFNLKRPVIPVKTSKC